MGEMIDNIGSAFSATFLGLESRLALVYLITTVVLAYAIWIWRAKPQPFLRWLMPSAVYKHRSNIVDLQLFGLNFLLNVVGFFALLTFTPLVTIVVLEQLLGLTNTEYTPIDSTFWRTFVTTVLIILTLDFCKYWTHYFHHESPTLWPFHAVHHSAEVLTPVTVSRVHPIYKVTQNIILAIGVGIVQAIILFAVMGKVDVIAIGSANVGYVLFNLFGANLRHTHIWLSYGRVLEHVFISPAQHQIHHSSAVEHHNKNYGEVFAFWDWMFGTLYVPEKEEVLQFGIADGQGNLIEQPHPTLRAAIIQPFRDSWQSLRKPTETKPSEHIKQQ
ncbi:sterol desaturase family protein [Yoonia sp. R2-816]|uniref:sterol desaturase family protein n=1 Tax=Yoonia sp. R2-816 TaxID=3342638 RepID=UPI00372A8F7A